MPRADVRPALRRRCGRCGVDSASADIRRKRQHPVMADKRNVWTVPLEGGGWGNRYEGSTRVMDRGLRKADVQKQGRERARNSKVEHIIQKADGTIGERNSYGGDSPRRPG